MELRTKVLKRLEEVLKADPSDLVARYIDTLNRLQDSLFWSDKDNETKSKDS